MAAHNGEFPEAETTHAPSDPGDPGDPPDPQLRQLLTVLRERAEPPMRTVGEVAARDRVAALRAGARPGPPMALVEHVHVATGSDRAPVPVRRYRAQAGQPRGVIVYFHGGGWVLGGLDESDLLCRTLAVHSGYEILSVGYRLAPEYPFPAAVQDADTALEWAAAHSSGPLVVMGDSAGGNLAAVAARRARDRGRPRIDLQVLVYPVTDHRMDSSSYAQYGHQLLISADDMDWFWCQYAPDPADRASSDASPGLVDDLTNLPPALIVVAEHDPLRDESLAYARRLTEAGVSTTVHYSPSMAHGFFGLVGVLDSAGDAVRAACEAIATISDTQPEMTTNARLAAVAHTGRELHTVDLAVTSPG